MRRSKRSRDLLAVDFQLLQLEAVTSGTSAACSTFTNKRNGFQRKEASYRRWAVLYPSCSGNNNKILLHYQYCWANASCSVAPFSPSDFAVFASSNAKLWIQSSFVFSFCFCHSIERQKYCPVCQCCQLEIHSDMTRATWDKEGATSLHL